MIVKNTLNVDKGDILNKKFNILIGISLGNKFFSKENMEAYIEWALDNTKEKIAILIPDKIHAINYEVKSNYSKMRADKVALKQGDKIRKICEEFINKLDKEKGSCIKILKWQDIETDVYNNGLKVINLEFNSNSNFKNLIIEIVKENVMDEKLNLSDYEKLAMYVIGELPMLISGVEYEGELYDLLPYPDLSKIDYLTLDLQEGKNFPNITNNLKIKSKLKIIELCAN